MNIHSRRAALALLAVFILNRASWGGVLSFVDYHTPAQVDAAMVTLNTTYPALTQIRTIGTSIEGRAIKALLISTTPTTEDPAKGDVVFVGCHHAREWISVEMALHVADELLARRSTDPELAADIDRLQIWIVPVLNPDGYAYTAAPMGNRYWRKNRRDNLDSTFGVDLNRNYGYQWGLLSGSSNMTYDETYHGTAAFSEPETQAIRDFLQARGNLKCFMSYHSYSELFLRPWAYTVSDPPGEPTLASHFDRARALILGVHAHDYGPTIGYTSAGEATDWVWETTRTAAFTTELRPATYALGGFSPSPSEIIPSNEENLPEALALVHDAARTGLWIADSAADTGAEPSAVWTGSGWSHPFWESPDITTNPSPPVGGTTVTLNVHIRNNTGATQNNVTVEAYYTDPAISIDFPNPIATLIGTQTVSVPAAGADVSMPWNVPAGNNGWGEPHWCVGVVIKHNRDLPLTTQVQRSSNVGCRNFYTGTVQQSRLLLVQAHNFLNVAAELEVKLDPAGIPRGWTVRLPQPPRAKDTLHGCAASTRKAKLLKAKGPILEPGETIYVPVRVDVGEGVQPGEAADVRIHAALRPLVAGKRPAVGNGYTYHLVVEKG
jgi:hypothetical protein